MEMRTLVIVFLLLDALVVAVIGATTIQGDHAWDFFLVNGARLAIVGGIVALWMAGASRRLESILFGRRPSQE